MKGSEIVVDVLQREGIDAVFGYPGAATLPIYDELYGSEVRHILVRHEQGAAHMADAYARVKGSPGVCIATSGAGATNLVTGIATAYLDSSPVVAITGQVPTEILGSDGFQEADIFSLMMPITKHNFRVMRPEDLAVSMVSAFRIATNGRYAPVHVDIPRDMQTEDAGEVEGIEVPYVNGLHKDLRGMGQAVRTLMEADRPLILLGGGAKWSGCGAEAIRMAESLSAPIVTTLMGKGTVPETHPLSLGMVGMHGRRAANYALEECDVMLAVGTRFSDRAVGDPRSCRMRVIHIDIDPSESGKNVSPDIFLCGNAREVMSEMMRAISLRVGRSSWSERIADVRSRCDCDISAGSKPISPRFAIHELDRLLPENSIVTTEVGQCQMWAAHFMKVPPGRRFITSGGLGTMGFGLPAALGAKVAAPDATVVDVAGDGSLTMVCQEIATAVEEDIPVLILLMNNGRLGMIRQHQRLFFGERLFAESLGGTDFVKLAEAFGARAARVEDPSDLASAIEEGISCGRAFLVDVQVDTDEDIFPMTLRGGEGTTVFGGSCPFDGA